MGLAAAFDQIGRREMSSGRMDKDRRSEEDEKGEMGDDNRKCAGSELWHEDLRSQLAKPAAMRSPNPDTLWGYKYFCVRK